MAMALSGVAWSWPKAVAESPKNSVITWQASHMADAIALFVILAFAFDTLVLCAFPPSVVGYLRIHVYPFFSSAAATPAYYRLLDLSQAAGAFYPRFCTFPVCD